MSFQEKLGDLFGLGLPALAHGCNCQGLMGAGVANQFRVRWPGMFEEYARLCKEGEFVLGAAMDWPTNMWAPEVIYNLATQTYPGPDASIIAIENSVKVALRNCEFRGVTALGVPHIGCGIGGLEWEDVRPVLRGCARSNPAVDLIAVTPPWEVQDRVSWMKENT
jgi:O-acetyl-ADP-ribose deacetylase (regulator of RNase III)